jgi:Carboxypeptidase regulatory-like domain
MCGLRVGLAFGAFLIAASAASAQQGTSELGGRITDAQGGVLPGVTITVTNEDTGLVREMVTGPSGHYLMPQMLPGRYRVAAKLAGFKALDRRGIVLAVGQTTTLDLELDVGDLAETVTVTSAAPLVDLSTAEVGGHISSDELIELPAANRNYMAFVGNVPGTVFVPSGEFLNDSFQANGQPTAANAIIFDGANNTDEQRGSNVGGQTRVANESIQEVQIITNQFDAEYGRASGAVINAVTKAGTNQFRGSAFGFFTGKAVTARDFFARMADDPKPEVGKEEWGGTFGGPIRRNRMFFFGSVERLVAHRNWSRNFTLRPEMNFAVVSEESAWNTLLRVDHQVTQNHQWAFRWQREYAPQFDRLDGTQETTTSYGDETDLDQTLVGTLTSVVSNSKVNTVRFGGVLEDTVHANPAWRALDPSYARCVPCPADAGIGIIDAPPRLDYETFDSQAATTMDYSIQKSYSIEDTFSWFIPDKKGRHDTKFGARYTHTWLSNPVWSNMNGSYQFANYQDRPFDPADPRSYPQRLTIRVPDVNTYELVMHVYEIFAQDKWQPATGLTISAGLRYDLEILPLEQDRFNPYFTDPSKYPVDKKNIAPRLGFIWSPDEGRSAVRAGYGIFYDKTLLGTVDNYFTDTKYARSFEANYPVTGPDLGPRNGQFPSDPLLSLVRRVDILQPEIRAMINALYPPGSTVRNTGTITWDDPEREQPYFHQMSAGYEREVFRGVGVSVDYVRMLGRDMFLNPNLNIPTGTNTVRDGPRVFTDPFGVLAGTLLPGEAMYTNTIRLRTTKYGYSTYDALNVSVEKRYANNWSVRGAYSLSYSRGVTAGQENTPDLQVGSDLNLDEWYAASGTDRRHNFVMSGRMEVPRTRGLAISGTLRMLSGTPFTIQDDTVDTDMNRINFQPLPAGTYNAFPDAGPYVLKDVKSDGGRNGARGPGFVQLDLRVGYKLRFGGQMTIDAFADAFNVTNRANFENPASGNRRVTADFLRLNSLVGGTGFPRQLQLGVRFGF